MPHGRLLKPVKTKTRDVLLGRRVQGGRTRGGDGASDGAASCVSTLGGTCVSVRTRMCMHTHTCLRQG